MYHFLVSDHYVSLSCICSLCITFLYLFIMYHILVSDHYVSLSYIWSLCITFLYLIIMYHFLVSDHYVSLSCICSLCITFFINYFFLQNCCHTYWNHNTWKKSSERQQKDINSRQEKGNAFLGNSHRNGCLVLTHSLVNIKHV